MRPRTTPLEAYSEIAEVAKQRDSIPSDRELAVKYQISASYVRYLMKVARKGLLSVWDVSRETNPPLHESTGVESAENAEKIGV